MLRTVEADGSKREPMGAALGTIGIGKSSRVGEAFPHYYHLTTSDSVYDGLPAYLEYRGKSPYIPLAVSCIEGQGSTPDLWNFFSKLPAIVTSQAAKSFKAIGKPVLGKTAFTALGADKAPHWTTGIVISDYTTFLAELQSSCLARFPKAGYQVGSLVQNATRKLQRACAKSGIGLILDGHDTPPKYAKTDATRIVPEHKGGMSTPWGSQRQEQVRDLGFSWQIVNPDSSDDIRLALTSGDRLYFRKTRAPRRNPPMTVILDKSVGLHELLVWCGWVKCAYLSDIEELQKAYPTFKPVDASSIAIEAGEIPKELKEALRLPEAMEIARRAVDENRSDPIKVDKSTEASLDSALEDDMDDIGKVTHLPHDEDDEQGDDELPID